MVSQTHTEITIGLQFRESGFTEGATGSGRTAADHFIHAGHSPRMGTARTGQMAVAVGVKMSPGDRPRAPGVAVDEHQIRRSDCDSENVAYCGAKYASERGETLVVRARWPADPRGAGVP